MTRFLRVCLWVLLSALLSAPSVLAQSAPAPDTAPPPAHVSLVEGQVFLEREGRSESAVENVPLLDGDRLRTEHGRVEIMLDDGSLLHLDETTTVDMLAGDLIRLLGGRINLVVLGARDPSGAVAYQIDAPAASVQSNGPGEYRVTVTDDGAGGGTTDLSVVRGEATFANDAGSVDVRAGERSEARDGEAPGRPRYFNSARWDAFDRWSAARRDAQIGTVSAQYLPTDLEPYSGTFDRYGTWRNDVSNGYVWFPTVSADWRPYSVGYWRQYDPWDSFWVAGDPWGWPTHHYGRWGFSTGLGWYWIPARSWASAFVYWALGGDYVSWCPLGWNDYPVFGNWGVRGVYVGLHDGWRGWTVIPRRHFGSTVFASRVAIDGRRLDSRSMSGFVAGRRSPTIGRAVPRALATATHRTMGLPPSGGARDIGTTGRGDGRLLERNAAPAVSRGERARQIGPTQGADSRSPMAAPTQDRYSRRTIPGSPAGVRSEVGASAVERQPLRQGGGNPGRQQNTWTEPGSTNRMIRRSLPGATPRASSAPGERASVRQPAPWSMSGERQPSMAPPRADPRSSPRDRSWATPRSAPEARVPSRPSVRPTPPPDSRPVRAPSAAPPRQSSPGGRSSAPASRYNPGSGTQPPPSRGTSSPPRGRGGAPE